MGFQWLLCFKYLCLYNNAAKIFDVEEVLRRRFVNLAIRKCFKQSEGIDYQRPPFEWLFLYFFSYRRWLCRKLKVSCGLRDHFATTVAHLLPKCALSVSFSFKYLCLYNNCVKIFGVEGVLRRRFAVLEHEMVYTIRGNICITRTSAWVFFFEKSFFTRRLCRKLCRRLLMHLY